MEGMEYSFENFSMPLNDPSPPKTISASIPSFFIFSNAAFLDSGVLNRSLLAVLRIVPPL